MSSMDIPDASSGGNRPKNELEVYQEGVSPSVDDEFLGRQNFGLGYYKEHELRQQNESFKEGMWAEAAFSRLVLQRAIHETKHTLAVEEWESLDPEQRDQHDRRRFIEDQMEAQWAALEPDDATMDEAEQRQVATRRRREKINDIAGIDRQWTPPHYRMVMARHEFSRSRGARLLDNLFGRVREILGSDDEDQSSRFFGGD